MNNMHWDTVAVAPGADITVVLSTGPDTLPSSYIPLESGDAIRITWQGIALIVEHLGTRVDVLRDLTTRTDWRMPCYRGFFWSVDQCDPLQSADYWQPAPLPPGRACPGHGT